MLTDRLVARKHAEWLSLIEISGSFLSMPVLLGSFPQGLDLNDDESQVLRRVRLAYDEWIENVEDKTIVPSDFHADKFSQIAYSMVGEPETKKTLYLLLYNKKSSFIAYENNGKFLSLLGTSLGSGVLNTLEQYKHILGDRKIFKIEVEFDLDQQYTHGIKIDKMRFHIPQMHN